MKLFKPFLIIIVVIGVVGVIWLGMLYRTYGMQTLLFLVQSKPEFIATYSKNMINPPDSTPLTAQLGITSEQPQPVLSAIPSKHMIGSMSHMYQKLNNCGPSSVAMAASVLGVKFDQFLAADVLKGSYADKNVSAPEMEVFLKTQGLGAIYRVNGNSSIVEQLVAQNIPVIVEQWLVKRGSGEHVGHYRVVRGYDQSKKLFTTNDSFNGPNFVIPYSQFDEWWRPFNRGYLVVYKPDQAEIVKNILGSDWTENLNWHIALETSQAETKAIGDGYSHFNAGTNAVLVENYALAGSEYDLALKESFPDHFLWYQFGPLEAYLQLGQYERVLDMTARLLAQAGEMEEARYYRGLVYAKQGKTTEAKSELEKALKANPRFLPASKALDQL